MAARAAASRCSACAASRFFLPAELDPEEAHLGEPRLARALARRGAGSARGAGAPVRRRRRAALALLLRLAPRPLFLAPLQLGFARLAHLRAFRALFVALAALAVLRRLVGGRGAGPGTGGGARRPAAAPTGRGPAAAAGAAAAAAAAAGGGRLGAGGCGGAAGGRAAGGAPRRRRRAGGLARACFCFLLLRAPLGDADDQQQEQDRHQQGGDEVAGVVADVVARLFGEGVGAGLRGAAISDRDDPSAGGGKLFLVRIALHPCMWFGSFNLNASFP